MTEHVATHGIRDLVEAVNEQLRRENAEREARGLAPSKLLDPPTDEQQAVAEAPPGAPALVAAGAGSGKTETMSLRALWLIANGHLRPHELLGLTFTRKAAGELADRMKRRVGQLRRAGLVPAPEEPGPGATALGESVLGDELLDAPRIATYNSFATQLYRDHAALLGRDADAAVLGEAGGWLLARELVLAGDSRLVDLDRAVDTVTSELLAFAERMAENLVDPEELRAYSERFVATVGSLAPAGTKTANDDAARMAARVAALPIYIDLAQRLEAEKAARGLISYSDQLVLALRIAREHPEVGAELRSRYRAVILDEYQDTSFVQTELLGELFAGHPVMAVGDPHQSIYAFRGASASNLRDFAERFGVADPLSLSISWRNGRGILDVANELIVPLAAAAPVSIGTLRPAPNAGPGTVTVRYEETVLAEAEAVAVWFEEQIAAHTVVGHTGGGHTGGVRRTPPTAALLLRDRKNLPILLEALHKRGLPVHVLGAGGLLAEPAIADLVAALTVLDDVGAGSELVRLLAGSRWRIGTADLAALRDVARWRAEHDLAHQRIDEDVRTTMRASVVAEDSASLVDALDFLLEAGNAHHAVSTAGFTEEGLRRLRDAAELFARLRRRPRFGLVDFVTVVIQELGLDIEAAANDVRSGGERVFEPFFDAIADFEQLGRGTSLAAFLGWLREAAERDRLSGPREEEPEPGTVQVLTIHTAKGLEWDLVAVPRLVEGEMPGLPQQKDNWVSVGSLPYDFRGDREVLPRFRWSDAADTDGLVKRKKEYDAGELARQEEEARRLAYVAVTRPRRALLLTGSWWASQGTARKPSPFLRELADAGVIEPLPETPPTPTKPEFPEISQPWPRDPLGARRDRVEASARLVEAAAVTPPDFPEAGGWAGDVALLLEERRRAQQGSVDASLPERIPASGFHEYVSDTAAVLARLRRPMPERPYRATRLGTLFHAWVEHRADPGGFEEELDGGLELLDDDLVAVDAVEFARLKAAFEASPWNARQPIDVEREIHLPFAGRSLVCKIDAVYEAEGGTGRIEIVDWKTGKVPRGAELERKQLQLALYRLAYAKWKGLDPALIDAAFYYVADDTVILAADLPSEEELLRRWQEAFGEG